MNGICYFCYLILSKQPQKLSLLLCCVLFLFHYYLLFYFFFFFCHLILVFIEIDIENVGRTNEMFSVNHPFREFNAIDDKPGREYISMYIYNIMRSKQEFPMAIKFSLQYEMWIILCIFFLFFFKYYSPFLNCLKRLCLTLNKKIRRNIIFSSTLKKSSVLKIKTESPNLKMVKT